MVVASVAWRSDNEVAPGVVHCSGICFMGKEKETLKAANSQDWKVGILYDGEILNFIQLIKLYSDLYL